ncbi:MAG: CPBP family intramembrane metalloprotease [Methanobacterium sp.]|uniref:CPBP family intramembrane glutamic endopeptidase n=1 Tax=Methanobacterium sp. TaxID=2164 RepID=UPI003D65920D|nr:CPBP family intramembrane metalloprotease [Methanobacterium sp.]
MNTAILEKGQLKKELFAFLIITFAATILLSFVIYLISGPISFTPSRLWYISFQACMLIPATVAIFCMVYFKSKALTTETKIIFTFFLIYTVLFIFESYFQPITGTVGMPIVALHPTDMNIPLISMIVAILGILTVIILNLKKKWREGLEPSKLVFGKNLRNYLIIPLILSLIIILNYILNYISGLGVPTKEFNLNLFFSTLIPSLILSFFLLWPNYFGEEYGWRAYLQDRLFPLFGSYKGVLLLGIIWGLWHAPLILVGLNFPGQPVLGIGLMIVSTIIMGIIFSYAVLKTGSVWIAVMLHMLVDTIFPVGQYFIATSINPIFSFGTGIYGFAIMAVFALILLKFKVWKINENITLTE